MATRKNTAETDARHTKILTDLQTQECNRVCADCNTKGPRWASVNLGVFLCIRCSGLHRQIGVAITKVRSTTLDTWTPEQIQMMVKTGNGVANLYYEANLPPNEKPNEHTDARSMENFIRNKYERFKWALERVPISEASSKTIRFISGGGASGGSSSSRKSSRRKRGEESERKPKSSRRHRMRDQDEYSPEEGASEDDEEERRRAERRAARRARRAQREAAQSSPAPAPSSTASSSRKVSSSSRRAAAVGDFEDDFEESPSQPHRRSKRSSRRSGLEEEAAAAAGGGGGASEDEDPFGFKSSAAKKAVAANSVEDLFAPSDFERKKWSILDGSAGAGADPTAHEAPRPANDIPQGMQAPGGGLFAPSGYAGMQPMQMGMSMMSIGQQQQQQGAGMFPMMQQHQGFAGMAQPYGYGMPMQQQGSGFAGMQMQPQQQGFGGMGFGYR